MDKKLLFFVVVFLVLLFGNVSAIWYDANCEYRRPINLSFTSGSFADYEAIINISLFPNASGSNFSDYLFIAIVRAMPRL